MCVRFSDCMQALISVVFICSFWCCYYYCYFNFWQRSHLLFLCNFSRKERRGRGRRARVRQRVQSICPADTIASHRKILIVEHVTHAINTSTYSVGSIYQRGANKATTKNFEQNSAKCRQLQQHTETHAQVTVVTLFFLSSIFFYIHLWKERENSLAVINILCVCVFATFIKIGQNTHFQRQFISSFQIVVLFVMRRYVYARCIGSDFCHSNKKAAATIIICVHGCSLVQWKNCHFGCRMCKARSSSSQAKPFSMEIDPFFAITYIELESHSQSVCVCTSTRRKKSAWYLTIYVCESKQQQQQQQRQHTILVVQ